MDWLVAFRDLTLPGTAASDDLHTGSVAGSVIDLPGGGGYDAHGNDVVDIRPFSLAKKIRVKTAATVDALRALVGKRGFLWRGRRVSSDVPLGAAFYLPFNANGVRANLTANDGTEPTRESGSVVGFPDDGKFSGGAVSVAGGFTNYVTNPVFANGTAGWTGFGGNTKFAWSSEQSLYSGYSCKISADGTGYSGIYGNFASGTALTGSVTFSARYYVTAQSNTIQFLLRVYYTDTTFDDAPAINVLNATQNTWLTATSTVAIDGAKTFDYARLYIGYANNATYTVYLDAIQLTNTTYKLPFRYYGMPGVSGAAGSTSVVAASRLEYSSDVLNADAGTIAAWIKPSFIDTTVRYIVRHYDGSNYFFIRIGDGSSFKSRVGNKAEIRGTVDVGNWQHVALTWDNGTAAFYVNGALSGSTWSYTGAAVGSNPLAIFADEAGGERASGEICGLMIAKEVLSAAEIAAIYNAGVPLDEARIQRGIDARCMELASTRGYEDVNHTDVTLNFAAIGRAWRGEVRRIANETLPASGSLTLANNGDVTCKNLVVRVIATGAATVTLSMNGFALTVSASAAGDELVIDCGGHTVRKNGANDYANVTFGSNTTADWLPLEPGDNTLSVTLSGAEIEMIAQWYDTYR